MAQATIDFAVSIRNFTSKKRYSGQSVKIIVTIIFISFYDVRNSLTTR
jgi:hypothetical protein